jgi:glutathione S-transferase
MLNLYFSPMACSLATRIALYEAGVSAGFTQVDLRAKRTADGSDFLSVNPMGQVPVLRTDDGLTLTENTAVLQHVADQLPHAELAPRSGRERAVLQQWLGFIGTELHKMVFTPLVDPNASKEAKAYAREHAPKRLSILENHLSTRKFLLDRFTVADAYLTTILNWAVPFGIDLEPWPAVRAYHKRMLDRPSVSRAVAEEFALYQEEKARQAASA